MASIVFLRFGQIWGTPENGWRPEVDELRDAYNFYRWERGVETGVCVSADSEVVCAYGDSDDASFLAPLADEMRRAGGEMPPVDKWSDDPAAEQLLFLYGMGYAVATAARKAAAVQADGALNRMTVHAHKGGRRYLLADGSSRERSKLYSVLRWRQNLHRDVMERDVIDAAESIGRAIALAVGEAAKELRKPVEQLAIWHVGPHLVSLLRYRDGVDWRRHNVGDPRIEVRLASCFGVTDILTEEQEQLAREREEAGA